MQTGRLRKVRPEGFLQRRQAIRSSAATLRLTDFLSELTSACPNARSIGWHERCAARFGL